MRKLIVIGLDGATWDVILPLVEDGKLPTFKKLLENGVWGVLESTIPPVTGPSWLSFATGKNPGKTGVYDFSNRENIYDSKLKAVSSKHCKGQSIWDYLSRSGYKVGVVAYPILYPPYAVNGFIVSGMMAPYYDKKITYPEELGEEIEKISGGYELAVSYYMPKYNDVELFLEDLNRLTDKQFKVVLNLLKTKEWDFFIYICSATDWIQHRMWKYIDRTHPQYDPQTSPKYAEEFKKFFLKIDRFLSQLINFDANLLIISDHGFGPQYGCFNLAKWLEKKGYVVKKEFKSSFKMKAKSKIFQVLRLINKLFKIHKVAPKVVDGVSKSLSTDISDLIDYENSKAYCLGHTIPFGAIYINQKVKRNQSEYASLKKKIIDDLLRLGDEIGKPLKITIYDSEKVYKGNKTDLAPDIIFTINNWQCVITENDINKPLFEEKPFSNRHTGSHRLDGIFLAYGPDIKNTGEKLENLRIYDLAPTILQMYNVPIPSDVDGRVLKEIFREESELAKKEIKYQETNEKEMIREKIKSLKFEKT